MEKVTEAAVECSYFALYKNISNLQSPRALCVLCLNPINDESKYENVSDIKVSLSIWINKQWTIAVLHLVALNMIDFCL